ncbi:hypothetical protein RB653_000255 [Dictyostelium firmibasis]|uniref:Homeobox domain-containing protein n=1 Tax=Dictyostelium firmibasis TaxID=79012 RepID=A0AAN7U2K0_9MYCE
MAPTSLVALPIIKLDLNDIENLNFSINDFLKEQDLHTTDEIKNEYFQKLILPFRESYEIEIQKIEEEFNNRKKQIINIFPPGSYPKDIETYLQVHLKYHDLSCLKVKCGLRARIFDLIQGVFNQNINIDASASATAAAAAAANANSTSSIIAANINKQHSLGKKKRKVDTNLDKWYEANINQPYPLYSDKIFLASISKISKIKVEEWMGNKRTRIKKKISKIPTKTNQTLKKVTKTKKNSI